MIVFAVGPSSKNGQIMQMLGLLDEAHSSSSSDEKELAMQAKSKVNDSKNHETKADDDNDARNSVLEQKQNRLSSYLTKFTIAIAVVVMIVRLSTTFANFKYPTTIDEINTAEKGLYVTKLVIGTIQLCVTVVVVGVPEGLLIATTLTATIAARVIICPLIKLLIVDFNFKLYNRY